MKTVNGMMAALAAGALLARLAGAEVSAVSDAAPLDTRSLSAVADAADRELDTISYTMAWSPPRKLSTKRIVGTMFLMR